MQHKDNFYLQMIIKESVDTQWGLGSVFEIAGYGTLSMMFIE